MSLEFSRSLLPQPSKRRGFFFDIAGCGLTAYLLLLAAPGENGLPWLAWLALVPLFMRLSGKTPKQAACLGVICGLFYFLPLLRWIIIVLSVYGHVALPIAYAALTLLALYMAGYVAVFGAIGTKLRQRVPFALGAPVLWVALDYVRGWLFTGFPWMDLGYSQYSLPWVIQAADLGGHHTLTFLIVLVNATLASLLLTKNPHHREILESKTVALVLVVLLATATYNFFRYPVIQKRINASERLRVSVVQGNVDQFKKWLPEYQQTTVDKYIGLSGQALAKGKSDLIIWPETAMPFYPMEHPLFINVMAQLARPYATNILTGAPHRQRSRANGPVDYYNSALLLNPEGRIIGRYDKQHLVPFGEYIPFRSVLAFAAPVVETLGDFSSGTTSPPLACQNGRIGVLICFESIFPEIAQKQVDQGANLLVNITNDAWFGKSAAPRQHLAMAVLRSVENRRSMARAANTGISCFIDPLGRVHDRTELFTDAWASRNVELLEAKTVYQAGGRYFPLACLAYILLAGILRIFSRRSLLEQ